jgi:hypothetical protein
MMTTNRTVGEFSPYSLFKDILTRCNHSLPNNISTTYRVFLNLCHICNPCFILCPLLPLPAAAMSRMFTTYFIGCSTDPIIYSSIPYFFAPAMSSSFSWHIYYTSYSLFTSFSEESGVYEALLHVVLVHRSGNIQVV